MDGTLAHAATGAPMMREHFEREGWARIERFLTLRDVESLRAASDELASKGAHLVADAETSSRRGEEAIHPGALRKITFASSDSVEVGFLRNDRRVLKLMETGGVSSPRWIVDRST